MQLKDGLYLPLSIFGQVLSGIGQISDLGPVRKSKTALKPEC